MVIELLNHCRSQKVPKHHFGHFQHADCGIWLATYVYLLVLCMATLGLGGTVVKESTVNYPQSDFRYMTSINQSINQSIFKVA